MRPTSEEIVLAYLVEGRRPVAQLEGLTGWPAGSIRRLISRQSGWQLDGSGRVVVPGPRDTRDETEPPPRETFEGEPREARVLFYAVKARRTALGLTLPEVAAEAGVAVGALDGIRRGRGSRQLLQSIEAWLARNPVPTEVDA